MLASFFCGEFLLHLTWLRFYVGSFSYTPHAGFFFFAYGEFLLHAPSLLYFSMGSFSYTSHAVFYFYLASFSCTSRAGFIFIWGVSLTNPMLAFFFFFFFFKSGEFLLHIPCWVNFYLGSLFYTSRADFIFYLGSFSYTSNACFIFPWGVSLTCPMLTSVVVVFKFWEILFHIPCWLHFSVGSFSFSYTSRAGFIFIWRVSLTNPMLVLFFFGRFSYASHATLFCFSSTGEFLLHIPCWLHFYLGGLSYTFRAGFLFLSGEFIFIWGVSLTHPCLLYFSMGSFSYTSHSGFFFFIWRVSLRFIFTWGVSLTHPMLAFFFFFLFLFMWRVSLKYPVLGSFLSGEFLSHIPC